MDIFRMVVLERSVGGEMSQDAHACSDVIRLRWSQCWSNLECERSAIDGGAHLASRTSRAQRAGRRSTPVAKSSGRRRFQRASQHVPERLGRPAAKALDVAGHNVERTCREARLDADDGIDAPGDCPTAASVTRV
jgi:hypothetical protein